jgi:hypothetical protein
MRLKGVFDVYRLGSWSATNQPLLGSRRAVTFRGLNFPKNDGRLAECEIGYYRSPLPSAAERIPPLRQEVAAAAHDKADLTC